MRVLQDKRRVWRSWWTGYLVEVEHHVVAEFACAEELSLLGDLQTVRHRNGVKHLFAGDTFERTANDMRVHVEHREDNCYVPTVQMVRAKSAGLNDLRTAGIRERDAVVCLVGVAERQAMHGCCVIDP